MHAHGTFWLSTNFRLNSNNQNALSASTELSDFLSLLVSAAVKIPINRQFPIALSPQMLSIEPLATALRL